MMVKQVPGGSKKAFKKNGGGKKKKRARAALAQFLDPSLEKDSCDSPEGVPAAAKPPTAEAHPLQKPRKL